jgi:outer membrane immunogenic protein
MKKALLCFASLVAISTSLHAADLPLRKPVETPVILPPPPLWTGPFVGGSIGGFFGGNPGNDISGKNLYCVGAYCTTPSVPVSFISGASGDSNSFAGGVQVGYNHQINPDLVFGGIVDFVWMKRSGSSSYSQSSSLNTGWTEQRNFSDEFKQNWLGTARLRFGPTFDRFWLYATGGLAFGDLKSSSTSTTYWIAPPGTPASVAASGTGSSSSTAWGWTLGVGGEYKLTPNLSLVGEYLYYSLDKSYDVTVTTNPLVTGTTASATYRVKAQGDGHLLKLGLNYAFWTY